ncbi:ubinuclein-2 isoform X2 [Octopus bimaculoides]|uniref:Ubinuclein middle domain-containing protein n=1 Tax=Octopus bimaculoides TaxID=37653 RepID=A0A0L8HFU0_OCTBM|nr:ubinuclein-2 isoform X2 [Octopus bimaculoides]|eukprot:XP_014772996.1 PREDICTED: ubinuclein-2-like isoform X2 [Octopus bimaculoides]
MNAMSDPRRLTFTTIGPMGKEKKKKSSLPPTMRFTLALRESNDKTCPEFSFADLMKNALGDCKNTDPNDFDLEDQNENERLVALAKSFEERYGPKHNKPQSKRLDAIQDLVDLGEGYDETDPFVDNSEARIITSDTESDGEVKKKVPEINKIKEGANNEVKKKVSGEKEFKKPRKPTSKEILRKKSSSTVKELLKNAVSTSSSTSNNGHIDETNGNIYSQTTPVGVLSQEKSSTNSGVYAASLPLITSSTVLELEPGSTEKSNINNFKEDSDSRDNNESIPKLSAGIPDHLEKVIYQLKQAAVDCMERKSKFFTSEINKMLLELEMGSRVLNCSQRTSVYVYLAAFLPCSKETLLKRVKKLFITQQDDKLKSVPKLKEALNEEVPDQLEKYKSEYQADIIKNVDFITPEDEEMKEDSSDGEEEKSLEEIEKTSLQRDYEWNEKMRILYKKSKGTHGSTSQIKPTKAMCNLRSQDISAGTPTAGSHSNSSPALQTDSLIACQQNAKADVTPILTTLANEMMDHSPTTSDRSEDKSLWNVLEYIESDHPSSSEENVSDLVLKSQVVSSSLHKTSQEENFGKGEKLNLNESSKTVHEISGNVNSTSVSPLVISSSSLASSLVSVTYGSPFSNQSTSPQISPTIPSVKVNYSQHSPTTSLSIKNHQHGTPSSSQSQGHTSSNKQPGGEQQKLPSHIGNVHSKSIQQSSPPGVVTSDSQNYHGYVDAMSVMVDSQLQQHNGQTTSNINSKTQQVSSLNTTYPNVKSKDSSQPNVQNKLTINMASKLLKASGIKGSSKKDTTALAAGSSEKSQNSDSKSSAQFSKDDSKNTYLAEFQRYAASCLVSKSGAPTQKVKTQPISSAASKAADERCQVQQQQQQQQQHRTTNQLSHSLTSTSSVHPAGKIETASTQQRNLHQTHSQQQQQQQQQSSLQHQKQQQQQHQKLHQQQNVVHGMSQSIGHSHSNKSHLSSHASKSWRQQQQQQQQSSQQHHNRHQQQHQQKSYSSLVSSKQLTSSSQVVNPTNCQSSQQQNHSKILSPPLQFQTTQQQQQQQTSRAISPHTSTTSLVKAECSSKHQSAPQCQSSSVIPAPRHSQPRQSSNAVTSSSSCSKSVSSSSSQRTHNIHSLYSTSAHSTQSSSLKQQQQLQQSKSQCLISTEKILTASTATHPTSASSPGSMYKLPTTPNISSSSGTVPTQSSSSALTAASVSQHQQNVARSQQGQNLHHQRTGILPMHVMGTQAKSSSNSCNTSSGTTTCTTTSANAVSVSTSQGKSSACSSWNLSGSNPQVSATSIAASTVASASASSNRTSSPVFNSTSYLQQQLSSGSHPQLKQQQVQHGSVASNRVSSAANITRTVSGLNQENLQPHSGSIHPAQVNQDSIRHSKSE